jgi:cell division protein FtsB
MSDIGRRIQRYRLSRYAMPQGGLPRPPRWVWIVAALWLAWVGVFSDHSLFKIWRASEESARTKRSLQTARQEIERLDREARDPAHTSREAERALRDDGFARPGEIIYRIEGGAADSTAR